MGTTSLDTMRQLGGHPWMRAAQQHGPRIVTLLLALWLAWLLASLVWQLIPQRANAPIKPPVADSVPQAGIDGPATTVDVSGIVAKHLFGVADKEDETAVVVPNDALVEAETDLPLELRGTLAASEENQALAIIADGREEKLYTLIGDRNTVRPGVTLHAVQATQVILNNRGKLETLKLPRADENRPAPVAPRRTRQRTAAPQPSVKQVLTENVTQFTQIVSPRPYFVGGQQRGYRLYPGRERQKFAALGLRPGDIVTEIDGTPLNNPTQGAQIFNSLANAQSVSVTLERNGSQQTLTLDISQLESAGQVDDEE